MPISLTVPILAGPFLRAVEPSAVSLWFASAEAWRPSDIVVQFWDPAPDGAHISVRSPEDRELFAGAQRVVTNRVHYHLFTYRVDVRFHRPRPLGRPTAYRLRIGKLIVGAPGGYPRLPSIPGPRAAGPTPGTFVVQPPGVSWTVACHGRSGDQHQLLDAAIAADPWGPTEVLIFGPPFRDPPRSIERAIDHLASELSFAGNPVERIAARHAASYLLGWSPIVLDTYAPDRDSSIARDVAALARVMGNVPHLVLDEHPPPGELGITRVVRERARALFGSGPDHARRSVVASPRAVTIAGVAPPEPPALEAEVRRNDDVFALSLSPGRGYLADAPPRPPSRGRLHVLAAPSGEVRPQVAGGLALEVGEAIGFASMRRVAASVVLSVHGRRTAIEREVVTGASALVALKDRAPGLYLAAAPDVLATLTARLARGTTILAETRPDRQGRLAWDLARIDGSCELRLASATRRTLREGTGATLYLEAGPFDVEVAGGRIAVIDDEVVPAPASTLAIGERYIRATPRQPHTDGNEIVTYIDGAATFRAMEEAMTKVTRRGHFIYLLGWWFDPFASLFPSGSLQAMWNAKAKAGVQFRVMPWWNLMKEARTVLHPAAKKWLDALPDGACIIDSRTLFAGAHHQKLMVMNGDDGLVAFCGGLDLNRDRVEPVVPGDPQHDVHCRVRGPAAHELLDVFVGKWLEHPEHTDFEHGGKQPKPPLLGAARRIRVDRPGTTRGRVIETYNVLHKRFRSACQLRRSQRDALERAIKRAQRYIYVEEQYFVSMEIAGWLRQAIGRGVHVAVLLPANEISAVPQIDYRRGLCFEEMRRASNASALLSLHELVDPRRGIKGEHTYIHAKAWMFDDEYAIVGTANANRRGISHDGEVGMFFESPAETRRLRVALWSEHLACPPAEVEDVAAGLARLRRRPQPATSRIQSFDERGRSPYVAEADIEASYGVQVKSPKWDWIWDHIVDPDADHLPVCD